MIILSVFKSKVIGINMKKFTILFIALVTTIFLFAGTNNSVQYREYHNKAINAYYNKNYKDWLKYNQKAFEIMPNNARTIYYLAIAHALIDNQEKALKFLSRAVEFGMGWSAAQDDDFKSLKGHPEFKKIINRIKELNQPVNNSTIAYQLKERDLIPEGLAYDPVEKCFYLSSLHKCKIVKIDKDGNYSNFTSEKQDGLRQVTGMKVDAGRRHLWVCSEVSNLNYINPDSTEIGWSGVFQYDLRTGKLINKYTIFEENIQHLFNDIVITKEGDVYLTDSRSQEIYKISSKEKQLKVFFKNEGFSFLNGIALSNDENSLYIADDGTGIFKLNLSNKNFEYLQTPDSITTIGIDGLYLYENSLIAVQNGFSVARINRFFLDKSGEKITRSKIIEMDNPHFIIPTTGAIARDTFYYIANSQLRSYGKDNNILPWKELKDIIILKAKL